MKRLLFPAVLATLTILSSCAPGIATRRGAVETAWRYASIEWTPREANIHHGPDADGITVHTPDGSLAKQGLQNGWWKPGQPARGMPYQWGGFDTPESFRESLARGEYAGDVSTAEKQKLGDKVVSRHACGIDCSGLISRCWNLPRPYSTRELPGICHRLASWDELKPGDILLNYRHVLMFTGWKVPGQWIYAYEAGPFPVWRVNAAGMRKSMLVDHGYSPWRYRGIID